MILYNDVVVSYYSAFNKTIFDFYFERAARQDDSDIL